MNDFNTDLLKLLARYREREELDGLIEDLSRTLASIVCSYMGESDKSSILVVGNSQVEMSLHNGNAVEVASLIASNNDVCLKLKNLLDHKGVIH